MFLVRFDRQGRISHSEGIYELNIVVIGSYSNYKTLYKQNNGNLLERTYFIHPSYFLDTFLMELLLKVELQRYFSSLLLCFTETPFL